MHAIILGQMPLVSKGTAIEMLATKADKDCQWCTNVTSFSNKEVSRVKVDIVELL